MNTTTSMDSLNTSSDPPMIEMNDVQMLRTQIKSNASLLFPKARSGGTIVTHWEIGVMKLTPDGEKGTHSIDRSYRAILTYPSGMSASWTVAARSDDCGSAIDALRSLFEVTAAALGKFQGNLFKDLDSPVESAGGIVDEALVRQTKNKTWVSSIF